MKAMRPKNSVSTIYAKGLLALLAVVFVIPTMSFAQDATGAAARQAEEISRRFSEQARQREENATRRNRLPPSGVQAAQVPPDVNVRNGSCFQVDKIQVSGVSLLSAEMLETATHQWQGRCIGLADLNAILEKITLLYISRGFIASRPYLPEQDLSSGLLKINVVEGSLNDIVNQDGPATPGQLLTAFPGLKGKPVNLREVEQGLDQINRLRSNKATIKLEAGKNLGDTILDVTIQKQKPWSLSIGSDNAGSTSTGIYQSHLDLSFDNLLGLNDQWFVNYQRSMARNPVYFSGNRPNSDLVSLSFSIPYGAWTFGVDSSVNSYHSSIEGQVSTIDTSGNSKNISPYLSWVFARDQVSKSWITSRLTWKSTDNFLLGSRLDNSSRMLSVASFELGHSRQILGGQGSASIGYKRGLAILGAFDDRTAPDNSPKAQYDALTYSVGYGRSHDFGSATGIFNSSLSGQWSNDPLFASEQMAFGGSSSVRGARDAILSSSNGILLRNELSLLLAEPEDQDLANAIGRAEPYIAVDFGQARSSAKDGSIGGNITGASVGLRNRGGITNFDISYSRILAVSGATKPDNGLLQARLTIQF
jgi:hemolysin activation/secretion protein